MTFVGQQKDSQLQRCQHCWKQISLTLAIADEHLSICKRRKAAVNADTALTMNDTLGSCGSTSHVNWSLFRPRNMLLSS